MQITEWSGRRGSNSRPLPWQGTALPRFRVRRVSHVTAPVPPTNARWRLARTLDTGDRARLYGRPLPSDPRRSRLALSDEITVAHPSVQLTHRRTLGSGAPSAAAGSVDWPTSGSRVVHPRRAAEALTLSRHYPHWNGRFPLSGRRFALGARGTGSEDARRG